MALLVLVLALAAFAGAGFLTREALRLKREADTVLLEADEQLRVAQYVANRSARWHG